MDEKEKQRMQRYYSELDEGSLLELLAEDKNDFQEGARILIIEEARRRGLDMEIKDAEIKEAANINVQGGSKEPKTIIKSGRIGLLLFVFFLLYPFVLRCLFSSVGYIAISFLLYAIPSIILIYYYFTFKRHPIKALWVGVIIGGIESLLFFTLGYLYLSKQPSSIINFFIMGAIRIGTLLQLWKAIESADKTSAC